MADFLHSEAIDRTLEEFRKAAQQVQVSAAAMQELAKGVNAVVERIDQALDRLLGKDNG